MENNKKIIVPTIIAVLILLILIVGAAYAYFTVSTANNFGTKTITATTPTIGSVALSTGTNLTMNLTASHMMAGDSDITYYASSNGTTTTETTETIGTATVTGEGTFSCDYTLTIDDNEKSLYDAFQSMSAKSTNQIVLTVNGTVYDFNTTNLFPKTITGTMLGLTSATPQKITAKLKLVNKVDVDQSSLAGKELTLTFNVTEFNCTATEEIKQTGAEYVLATASSDALWDSTLEDDGIRFIGTDPSNYVCFGYSDSSTDCDLTNTTNSALYAYRIIGIFEDAEGIQHLKLIKKEPLDSQYAWHSEYNDTDWNGSDLYKGLNGSYFLNNTKYLTSDSWQNKITTWDYTVTNTYTSEYSGPDYSAETAQNVYLHEMARSSKTSTVGAWKKISSKIGLMYVSDFLLSLGENALSYTSSSNYSSLETGWMLITNNIASEYPGYDYELTMTRYGMNGDPHIWYVDLWGHVGNINGCNSAANRPVFYLTDDVTISGEGTLESPFIVS